MKLEKESKKMKPCCKTYLDEQFGGDADIVNEIYAEYVASIGEKLAEAEAALSSGDWVRLDRSAHTIKGNALSSGDTEMAETAIEMRKAATLSDAALAASLMEKIKKLAGEL